MFCLLFMYLFVFFVKLWFTCIIFHTQGKLFKNTKQKARYGKQNVVAPKVAITNLSAAYIFLTLLKLWIHLHIYGAHICNPKSIIVLNCRRLFLLAVFRSWCEWYCSCKIPIIRRHFLFPNKSHFYLFWKYFSSLYFISCSYESNTNTRH